MLVFFTNPIFEQELYSDRLTEKGLRLSGYIEGIKGNNQSFNDIKLYYLKCYLKAVSILLDEDFYEIDESNSNNRYEEYFNDLANSLIMLEGNENVVFLNNRISITLNKNTELENVINFIDKSVDVKNKSLLEDEPDAFENFFDYEINYLSDGEWAYIYLFSTLEEQIAILFNQGDQRKSYIILLDEPEIRMHPELMRTFIDYLITYLSKYKEKNFK